MAYTNLKRYLLERLLDLDSSLSISPGSEVYSKVVDPLMSRIGKDPLGVDIESFIVQRLKDDPLTASLDMTSAGSFLKDVVARPLALLLEPLQREIEYLKSQQSIENVGILTDEEVDALLSNLFITRKVGDKARGSVQIFFSTPKSVSLDASIIFSTAAGLQFSVEEPEVFSPSEFVKSGSVYYVEVEIASIVPHSGANIPPGEISFVQGLEDVIRVSNPNSFTGGVTEETSASLLARAQESLSERSLNTKRGLTATLFQEFGDIQALTVKGYRDPEMQRDVLKGAVTTSLGVELAGKVLYTTSSLKGVPLVSNTLLANSLPDTDITLEKQAGNTAGWGNTQDFPFTTGVQMDFSSNALYLQTKNLIKNAKYLRVFGKTGVYDLETLGRLRAVSSMKGCNPVGETKSDNEATSLRVFTDDFTILQSGGTAYGEGASTEPNDNRLGYQGADYHLKNSDGTWVGAPLPFTDLITLGTNAEGDSLKDYQVSDGRDFLVLRGWEGDTPGVGGIVTGGKHIMRAVPIRAKIDDKTLRVYRPEHLMVSRRKITLPLKYTTDKAVSAGVEAVDVISFGGPKGGDPVSDAAEMFAGVDANNVYVTEVGGNLPGVALYVFSTEADGFDFDAYVELPVSDKHPNGWADLVEEGQFISLAGSMHSTDNHPGLFDFWQNCRIERVLETNPHFMRIKGFLSASESLNNWSQAPVLVPNHLTSPNPVAGSVKQHVDISKHGMLEMSYHHHPYLNFKASGDAFSLSLDTVGDETIYLDFVNPTTAADQAWWKFVGLRYSYAKIEGVKAGAPFTVYPGVAASPAYEKVRVDRFGGLRAANTAVCPGFTFRSRFGGSKMNDIKVKFIGDLAADSALQVLVSYDGNGKPTIEILPQIVGGVVQTTTQDLEDVLTNSAHPSYSATAASLVGPITVNGIPTGSIKVADQTVPATAAAQSLAGGDDVKLAFSYDGVDYLNGPNDRIVVNDSYMPPATGIPPSVYAEKVNAVLATLPVDTLEVHAATPEVVSANFGLDEGLIIKTKGAGSSFDYDILDATDTGWHFNNLVAYVPNDPYPGSGVSDADSVTAQEVAYQFNAAPNLICTYNDDADYPGAWYEYFTMSVENTVGAALDASSQALTVMSMTSNLAGALTLSVGDTATGEAPEALKTHMATLAGAADAETIAALTAEGVPDGRAFSFPKNSRFRLHWTVYRNELELLLPDGTLHSSFDDISYLPAYNTTGWGQGRYNALSLYHGTSICGLDNINAPDFNTDFFEYVGPLCYGSNITGEAYGASAPEQNRVNWAILRLRQDVRNTNMDVGLKMTDKNAIAEPSKVSPVLQASLKYPAEYMVQAPAVGISAIVSDRYMFTPTITPFAVNSFSWSDVGALSGAGDTISYTAPSGPNYWRTNGFSLDRALSSELVLQFYAESALATAELPTKLTISEIPGSYPFPDTYKTAVTIEDDEVHVGGMTDVYLKGPSVEGSTASFEALPDDITPSLTGGNVVLEATDGILYHEDAPVEPSHYELVSSTMASAEGPFSSAELASGAVGYILHIVSADDEDIDDTYHRILGEEILSGNTIRVGAKLNSGAITLNNVHFRILKDITVDLADPKKVLLVGTDLRIPLEENAALSDAGFSSLVTDHPGPLLLDILDGVNIGTYSITSATVDKLVLSDDVTGIETGLPFKIYEAQAGVSLPLVRLTGVEIASGEGEGIKVPYAKPVEVLAESFSGLNNDPVQHTSNSLVLRKAGVYAGADNTDPGDLTYAAGTYETAQLYALTEYDWAAAGIIPYDVIKIEGGSMPEDHTYWWVREIKDGVLVLDKDASATYTQLNATVGKPSLGEVQLSFLEPTYFEVGPETVLTDATAGSTATNISLRPSPAEKSEIYGSEAMDTDVLLTTSGVDAAGDLIATLKSSSLDFTRLNLKVGDVVTIGKKVLVSSPITVAVADDLDILINKALVLLINNQQKSILFKSTSHLTLDDVVNQINAKFGSEMRVEKAAAGDNWELQFYSRDNAIEIQDSSPNVLTKLGLSDGQVNSYSNAGATVVVTDLDYAQDTGIATLTVKDPGNTDNMDAASNVRVFVTVGRNEYQVFYPGDMERSDDGLYTVSFTASSRSPLTTERLAENTQMGISGYHSLGYTLDVENVNYSYSGAERVFMNITPTVLDSEATNWSAAFVTSAELVVDYERSQLVDDVQAYLLSDFSRVVCNNPLARHYLPAYVYLSLTVNTSNSGDFMKTKVADFIRSLFPNRVLQAHDLAMVLANSGATYVENPIVLKFLMHDATRNISVVRSENAILLDDKFHIMENTDNITVNT